jgi:hypothetical protein
VQKEVSVNIFVDRKKRDLMRLLFKHRHLYEDQEPVNRTFSKGSSILVKIVFYTKHRVSYD